MSTAFTQSVLGKFEQIDRGRPDVICESESDKDFGNANVTLELDGLRLHVVNDRGVQTVEIGLTIVNPVGPPVHPALIGFKDGDGKPTCPLEVLAVANGWVALEELVKHYDLEGNRSEEFAEALAAPPFYELSSALSLLEDGEKWMQLVAASMDHSLQMKAGDIEAALQRRLEKLLEGESEGMYGLR